MGGFKMKKSLLLLGCLVNVTLLSGCAAKPVYVAPASNEPRAFAKFEYVSQFSMTAGQLITYDGEFICGDHEMQNSQRLYMHGKNNPLIRDINTEGSWIRAGKNFTFYGYAVISTVNRCKIGGSFTPADGGNYTIRLTQPSPKGCELEVLDSKTNTLVEGFKTTRCDQGGPVYSQ